MALPRVVGFFSYLSCSAFFLVSFVSLVGSACVPLAVSAQATESYTVPQLGVPIPGLDLSRYPIVKTNGSVQVPFFAAYVTGIYKYMVGVSVIVAAIMIVYGGFLYVIGGSISSITQGKEIVIDALIGMVLVFSAYQILATISGNKTSPFIYFQPLSVKVIDPVYFSHANDLDGVPLENMKPWDNPAVGPATEPKTNTPPLTPPPTVPPGEGGQTPPAQSGPPAQLSNGIDKPNVGKNCSATPTYPLPPGVCSGFEACQARFCAAKDYAIKGFPTPEELVGFPDFPATVGEQITQKGLTFVPPSYCSNPKGCDGTKYFSIVLSGPSAKPGMVNRMKGSMIFRPEARDGLIRAGEEAKKQGYFLAIGDGTRTTQTQASNWCQRIADSGSPKGMATPGNSPHQLAVAVDIGLFRVEDAGKVRQLTLIGAICQQVEIQKALGEDNLHTLEKIMASAGFRHMCQEVWHFDYQGVYGSDCAECEFPGAMAVRTASDKTCGK